MRIVLYKPVLIVCLTLALASLILSEAALSANTGRIYGSVVFEDRTPAKGVGLKAKGNRTGVIRSATTTQTGQYEFTGLANDAYYVEVLPPSNYLIPSKKLATVSGGPYKVPTFELVKKTAIPLTPAPTYSLQVTVRDKISNIPLSGASVTLSPNNKKKLTNSTGIADFGSIPGVKYTITTSLQGYSTVVSPFTLSSNSTETIFLQPTSTTVTIRDLPINVNGNITDKLPNEVVEQSKTTGLWYKMEVRSTGTLEVIVKPTTNLKIGLYRQSPPNYPGAALGSGLRVTIAKNDICNSRFYYAHVEIAGSVSTTKYEIYANLDTGGAIAPDLLPVSVTPDKQQFGPSDLISLGCQLSNPGLNNPGTFSNAFYASKSPNASIDLANDIQLAPTPPAVSGGIAPGQFIGRSYSFSSQNLSIGQSYYLKVWTDPGHAIFSEIDCNNVCVSKSTFAIGTISGQETRRIGNRLIIEGQFDKPDGQPYKVLNGTTATINEFILAPGDTEIDPTTSPTVVYRSKIFQLQPSAVANLVSGAWDIFDHPFITLDANTGQIRELNGVLEKTFSLPPNLSLKVKNLAVNHYSTGGITGTIAVAMPLSISERATATTIMAKAYTKQLDLFSPHRNGWIYADPASATFTKSSFDADFTIDGIPAFSNAILLKSVYGGISTGAKTITIRGTVELPLLAKGITITLNELTLVQYYQPDDIDIVATGDVPVIPTQVPGLYVLAFDTLEVEAHKIFTSHDDLTLGGALGVAAGYVSVPNATLKIMRVYGKGSVKPNLGEFHVEGNIKLFIYKGPPKDFNGFDLLTVTCDYHNSQKLLEGNGDLNLYGIFKGHGEFAQDGRGNYFSALMTGDLSIPEDWIIFGGVKIGNAWARVANDTVWGTAKAEAFPGVGFRFNRDGTYKLGTNLYEDYEIQRKPGLLKTSAATIEDVPVPANQPYAIIRLAYNAGDTTTSLSTPGGTTFDQGNAAIVQGYYGPVFYRKNPNVIEGGQPVREQVYYLVPPAGSTTVPSGNYSLNIDDAAAISPYKVEMWLPNKPPSITVSEPSTDLNNPPNVNIQWDDIDPDSNADVLLFYDTDRQGYDGQLVTVSSATGYGPLPIEENIDGASDTFTWNTTGVPSGTYFVYAMIADGSNTPTFSNYAPGKITIVNPLAPSSPSSFTATPGQSEISCEWTHSATSGVQFVLMYDRDIENASSPYYEHSLAVEDLTQWTITGLQNGFTYRVAVAALDSASGFRSPIVGPKIVSLITKTGNNAPSILSSPIRQARVGYPHRYQVFAQDPDGEPLAYQLVTCPTGMMIDQNTGLITFDPVSGHIGSHKVEIQVRDRLLASDSQVFYLNVDDWMTLNRPPEFDSIPHTTAIVGEPFAYAPKATDPDGNSVDFRLVAAPPGVAYSTGTNSITWTPTRSDFGSQMISLVASDSIGGTTTQSFFVNVLYPPMTANFVFAATTGTAPFKVTTVDHSTGIIDRYEWDFNVDGLPDATGLNPSFTLDNAGITDASPSVTLTVFRDPSFGDTSGASASITKHVTVRPRVPQPDFEFTPKSGISPMTVAFTNRSTGGVSRLEWDFISNGIYDATNVLSPTFTYSNANFRQDIPVTLRASGLSGTNTITKYVSLMQDKTDLITLFEDNFNDTDPTPWVKMAPGEIPEQVSSNFLFNMDGSLVDVRNSAPGLALIKSATIVLSASDYQFSVFSVGDATGSRSFIIRSEVTGDYYRISQEEY